MAAKDILFPILGHPEATPHGAAAQAVALAAALGARLTAVRFDVGFPVPANVLANTLLDLPAMVAEVGARAAAAADGLAAELARAAEGGGAPAPAMETLACPDARLGEALAERARVHDLTVFPVAGPGGPLPELAEQVVFGAGRPLLLLPCRGAPARDVVGAPAVVAWDHGRPAARAVADALPLLARASSVHLVTVADDKALPGCVGAADLARNLETHGVKAAWEAVPRRGRPVAAALADAAAAKGAGLLVMGAFGHSRLREFILGGATRDILRAPPLPVLLSH